MIDRISKIIAVYYGAIGILPCYFFPGISFELVFNRGVSCGIFHQNGPFLFNGIILVTMVITIMVGRQWYRRLLIGEMACAEMLVFIGSFSNIIDRLWYGGVVDFIVVSFYGTALMVCNIADIYITLGVCGLLYNMYRTLYE